jgi:hypothetical protein
MCLIPQSIFTAPYPILSRFPYRSIAFGFALSSGYVIDALVTIWRES